MSGAGREDGAPDNRTLSCAIPPITIEAAGRVASGSLVVESKVCISCAAHSCVEQSSFWRVQLCEHGINYVGIGRANVVRGFVLPPDEQPGDVKRQLLRLAKRNSEAEPASRIDAQSLRRFLALLGDRLNASASTEGTIVALDALPGTDSDTFRRRVSLPGSGLLNPFEDRILHDVLQLLSTVSQNLRGAFALRYGSDDDDKMSWTQPAAIKLQREEQKEAWQNDKAAIHLLHLATVRLRLPKLVSDGSFPPDRVQSVYGVFMKIGLPYEAVAAKKQVRFQFTGLSYGKTLAPTEFFDIPPLAVIDNAVKYAPRGSNVAIVFSDAEQWIFVRVTSFGPRIELSERDRIFSEGFRASAARAFDGSGFGLAQAKSLLEEWRGGISVEQDDAPTGQSDRFRTTFVLRFLRSR